MLTIYTIGHSTLSMEDFLRMLNSFGVRLLVDIRTVPGSRFNPQYGQAALKQSLKDAGLAYVHLTSLGGLRQGTAHSVNMGWKNKSFRGYADYMQTPAFAAGIEELMRLAGEQPTAIMCAEAVPWRCHRSLVGDALSVRGVNVMHIMGAGKATPHQLTSFACVEGHTLAYPGEARHG